jgi:hypothetical protein
MVVGLEARSQRRGQRDQAILAESLSSRTSAAIRSLSAAREKKVWLRVFARTHRWTRSTPPSTFALSRGLFGRAGKIVVP